MTGICRFFEGFFLGFLGFSRGFNIWFSRGFQGLTLMKQGSLPIEKPFWRPSQTENLTQQVSAPPLVVSRCQNETISDIIAGELREADLMV